MTLHPQLVLQCGSFLAVALSCVNFAWSQHDDFSAPGSPLRVEVDERSVIQPPAPALAPAPQPGKKPGYSGLRLRQNPEGVVVVGVQPGPFAGDGFQSSSIWRGDLIVSINGESLDLAGFKELLKALAAGDRLRVVYRRSPHADPRSAVPHGDPNGEERSTEIVLDEAAKWTGTIGQGLRPGRVIASAQSGEFEGRLFENAQALGLRSAPGGLDALLAHLASLQQSLVDPNSLPAVVQAFERPLSLDRVEAEIASEVRALARPQSLADSLLAVHQFLLRTLAIPDLSSRPDVPARLSAARGEYEQRAASLIKEMRDNVAPLDQKLPQYVELMRASPEIVPLSVAMLPAAARRAMELEQFAQEVLASPQPVSPELVEPVRAAVQGPVLGAKLVDGELWVVGGEQANHYDMALVAAVYDVDGADTYWFSTPPRGMYQIVIDQGGDDLYQSAADLAGPAAAVFSVTILVDRAGNDRYVSQHQGTIAAGLFGVAILIDEAGDDRYVNNTADAGWSEGIGFYGAGLLIDRAGDDLYQGQKLAQGVGGPAGIGLICDTSGNDTYTANGPHFASVYGEPGIFVGMSQGFGYGIRGYASGGIGAIYDFAGNDRYFVGEFGQGSSYFQGLGILHDAAGQDQYVGSRYAQASGAHQSAGILIDDAGDDSYSCLGSACQAGAWDESVAMLVERGGNDTYSGGGLAQGSAAQQAIGILLDLDGQDSYSCVHPCRGQGGDNTYHYDADKVFSLSVLIDGGSKADTYSTSYSNNQLIRAGTFRQDNPASSDCCGLFSDD